MNDAEDRELWMRTIRTGDLINQEKPVVEEEEEKEDIAPYFP